MDRVRDRDRRRFWRLMTVGLSEGFSLRQLSMIILSRLGLTIMMMSLISLMSPLQFQIDPTAISQRLIPSWKTSAWRRSRGSSLLMG